MSSSNGSSRSPSPGLPDHPASSSSPTTGDQSTPPRSPSSALSAPPGIMADIAFQVEKNCFSAPLLPRIGLAGQPHATDDTTKAWEGTRDGINSPEARQYPEGWNESPGRTETSLAGNQSPCGCHCQTEAQNGPLTRDSESLSFYYNGSRSIQQIPIYIETLTGTTFEMQISPQETILCVKNKLHQDEGIPAAHQHLIWQGEELKDDFTLEEYGIGFGAILKLVLELRGGPLNTSNPSMENQIDPGRSGFSGDGNQSREPLESNGSNNGGGNSVRVLIFQNGDEIRMITIGRSDNQGTSSSLGSGKPSAGNNGVSPRNNSPGLVTMDNGYPDDDDDDRDEQRKRENDLLREKMAEIQRKMKSLALRRRKNLQANGRTPVTPGAATTTRLPMIIDPRKNRHHDVIPEPDLNSSKIHFPPLIGVKSPSRSKNHSQHVFQAEEAKKFSTRKNAPHPGRVPSGPSSSQMRPKSSGVRCFKGLRSRDRSGSMIETQNDPWQPKKDSQCGFVVTGREKRPKTTPGIVVGCMLTGSLGGSVDCNQLQGCHHDLIDPSQSRIQGEGSMNQEESTRSHDSNHEEPQKGSLDSGSDGNKLDINNKKSKTLPPVNKLKNKPAPKRNRCCACNKRLGLASKYDCRCGMVFCSQHRYAEAHDCTHDYRSEGRRLIALNNPVVKAPKLPKI